jgi:AmiR/NasT family two-component response regulator
MLIAFLTNDLVFPSRVRPVAERLGARFETAMNPDGIAAKLSADPSTESIVLIDLNSNADPAATIAKLKSLPTPPRAIVAFGPHVHEARLAAARDAGCDLVLTRGQFDSQIESLLEQLTS